MRCGKCKVVDESVTVDQIKRCYAGEPNVHAVKPVADNAVVVPGREPQWPPSDAQVAYVLGLQTEKALPDEYDVLSDADIRTLDKDVVSNRIKTLLAFPSREPKGNGKAKVEYTMPAGRYALMNDDNEWRFYQVDKPDKGRWSGYVFIKHLIGSPGDYRTENVVAHRRKPLLDIIESNAQQAMVDYGKQTQHCGRCASPLTHKRSRAAGYGEKCASVLGWPW